MKNYWWVKISVITFFMALGISLLSELASSVSGLVVATLILFFLIIVSVLTDGIGVSVTACDITKIERLVKKGAKHSKAAYILVVNAERVNNICADVIGDICSIISGACGAAIVVELLRYLEGDKLGFLISIVVSSLTAAFTVGGKAFVKSIAMHKAEEFVLYSAKILSKIYNIEKHYDKVMSKRRNK